MSDSKIRVNTVNPALVARTRNIQNQPNFTGAASYVTQITDSLPHAKTIRRMEALKWLKGEIGGILITAIGTGFVAPIFIGFNPFTKLPKNATPEQKEDFENTKKYTAMRQPISAILAILFQASVQKYIDKGLDTVFNNPKFAKYGRVNVDQQEINTETRIKDIIKKEMKEEKVEKPSWIKALFSKEAKERRNNYTLEFDKRVKARQAEQIEKVADKFQVDGRIHVGERHMDNKSVAELVNSQIEEYITDAKRLQKGADQLIPHYLDRADILIKHKEKLTEIIKPFVEKGEITREDLNTLIAKNNDNPEIKKLLEEVLQRPDDLHLHRMKRTLERINTIEKICGGQYDREIYRKKLVARDGVLNGIISELSELKIKDPQAADENIIKQTIEKIAQVCNFSRLGNAEKEILKNTDTFGNDLASLTRKVFKDVTKRYKKLVDNHYKSWNQFTKIGIGVFITLPITCTALNWVYPRFMELFFPKLSGVKKGNAPQKGGDK